MSQTSWKNRITGIAHSTLDDSVFPGLYALVSPDAVHINHHDVLPGQYLLPLPGETKATDEMMWAIGPYPEMDASEHESLLVLESAIGNIRRNGWRWSDWLDMSPLILAHEPEVIKLTPIEKLLILHAPQIHHICRLPRVFVTQDSERMPLSRARRVPAQAIPFLAGHPEDWEHRVFDRVRPRRILSMIPKDLYDFYENRLVVCLVDDSERRLKNRLANLEGIKNYESIDTSGTRFRKERILTLLGEKFADWDALDPIKDTIEELTKVYKRFRRMKGMPFCRQMIPSESLKHFDRTLRSTNILTNDRYYRFARMLWKETVPPRQDNTVRYRELQALAGTFDNYAFLVIAHALEQLGFTPASANVLIGPESSTEFTWKHDSLLCIRLVRSAGIVEIASGSNILARFVSVPLELAAAHFGLSIPRIIREVDKNALSAECDIFVLYVGSISESGGRTPSEWSRPYLGLGIDQRDRQSSGKVAGLIPISAFDLENVERVGRAIRWSVWRAALAANYPVRFNSVLPYELTQPLQTMSQEWLSREKTSFMFRRMPKPAEITNFMRELTNIKNREASKPPANRRKVYPLEENFEDALAKLRLNARCPICGAEGLWSSDYIDPDCFRCSCVDCVIQWGLNRCAMCKKTYPFIQHETVLGEDFSSYPEWVDRIWGMDLLAVPCERNLRRFVCPNCGQCGGNDPACARCKSLTQPEAN